MSPLLQKMFDFLKKLSILDCLYIFSIVEESSSPCPKRFSIFIEATPMCPTQMLKWIQMVIDLLVC